MLQFSDRIAQKIEMPFLDYEIGVNMGQKAKNAGKRVNKQDKCVKMGQKAKTAGGSQCRRQRRKQEKCRCVCCNCKYNDTFVILNEKGDCYCKDCCIELSKRMKAYKERWALHRAQKS